MKIEKIELRKVQLSMKRPFVFNLGSFDRETHVIVTLFADGLIGYGECPTLALPVYSYEFADVCFDVLKRFLAPTLLGTSLEAVPVLDRSLSTVRGYHIGKAGLECAMWHLISLSKRVPLWQLLGGTRTTVQVGYFVGIKGSISELLDEVRRALKVGFKRVKLKIRPGWDLAVVQAVREEFGAIELMVDANGAYTLDDMDLLLKLDACNLIMIEQPLSPEGLLQHSMLQGRIHTPICLDESISDFCRAEEAVKLGSCRVINVKIPRVGGISVAKKIYDLCIAHDVGVWCGGMLEYGVGCAYNIAFSTLPNITHPADVTDTKEFYEDDIVRQPMSINGGQLQVPAGIGIGVDIDQRRLDKYTVQKEVIHHTPKFFSLGEQYA